MVTYDLTIEKQRIIGADKFSIASNANETVCLRFHFDRSWRRFDSKAAVFKNINGEFYIIEVLQERVKIPWEVLTQDGEFELSLIGYEDTKVLTSDKVSILVTESLLPEDCKALSPTEVLFDRFKRECIAQAYLDYENEIKALKAAHVEEKFHLSEQITAANEEKEEAVRLKDEELERLKKEHTLKLQSMDLQLSKISSDLKISQEKAKKWEMVDYAIGLKTRSVALWSGGDSEYSLPMMNTSNITTFSASNFSNNIKSIGIDLNAATTFSSVFIAHPTLTDIALRNTQNITVFESTFEGCKRLRSISLGDVSACTKLNRFVFEATSLEKISFEGVWNMLDSVQAFYGCLALKTIEGTISFKNANYITAMFGNCSNLENVSFMEDSIELNIDFSSCVKLSKESMLSIANGLSSVKGGNLILSDYAFQNNFAYGTERAEFKNLVEDIKGWTLNLD